MTAAATLFLVSACGTPEEFVAAFRRYADRTGIFVPATTPLPAGRRGRLAITLKDGGVMIEGEAEILQSSAKPTVLHGRPGMTVKFVNADELSKVVIAELEKARLAMKPAPTSVVPRPTEIPAEPRPVVPAVGGRIDAANALAECVVIGDASQLIDTANAPKAAIDPGSGKAPIAVPSIPGVGPNSRLTSVGFPALEKLPAFPPKTNVPGAVTPAASKAAAENPLLVTKPGAPVPPNRATQSAAQGMPALEKRPERVVEGNDEPTAIGNVPVAPANQRKAPQPRPPVLEMNTTEPTAVGEAPPKKKTDPMATAAPAPAAVPETSEPSASAPTPLPPKLPSGPSPSRSAPSSKATSIGFPVVRTPFETQPVGVVRPPGAPQPPVVPGDGASAKSGASSPGPRGKNPTRPPLTPRHPTPVAPVPIVRPPAKAAPQVEDVVIAAIEEEEKTDLSTIPQPPPAPAFAGPDAAGIDPRAETQLAPQRSGGMRASEILAAIPNDDWTMSPDAAGPTVLPAATDESTKAPKGPLTGNWSISLDPEAGWSEPVKLEKTEAPKPVPKKREPGQGNPDKAVSDEKGFTAVEWAEKPTGLGEAKIEIDSTLMEPLKPMPAFDDDADPLSAPPDAGAGARSIKYITPPSGMSASPVGPNPFEASRESTPYTAPVAEYHAAVATLQGPPPVNTGYAPSSQLFAQAGPPADPNAQYGMMGFHDYTGGAVVAPDAARRKRTLLIGAGAIAALAGGFVLVLLLGGGKTKQITPGTTTKAGSGSARAFGERGSDDVTPAGAAGSAEVAVGSGSATVDDEEPAGSAVAAVQLPDDAGVDDKPPVEAGPCKVAFTSVPNGADVYRANTKLGTTPFSTELPCGVEAKVTLRKAKFINTARSFTPADGKANKIVVKLAKTTFTLKITSSPAGATINVGGKSVGVTPTTIRLPAFEASAIMVSKPGYGSDNKTVTPKSNNTSHHVVLKKGRR